MGHRYANIHHEAARHRHGDVQREAVRQAHRLVNKILNFARQGRQVDTAGVTSKRKKKKVFSLSRQFGIIFNIEGNLNKKRGSQCAKDLRKITKTMEWLAGRVKSCAERLAYESQSEILRADLAQAEQAFEYAHFLITENARMIAHRTSDWHTLAQNFEDSCHERRIQRQQNQVRRALRRTQRQKDVA